VTGTKEEEASHAAYKAFNVLLDHRLAHCLEKPFLCDFVNLDKGVIQEYTFRETSCLVSAFSRLHVPELGTRLKGEPARVVGILGRSRVDYELNDHALMRM